MEKEIENKIKSLIEKEGLFKMLSVENVNHNPHPYTIGPQHITYAGKHSGGMLDERTLKEVKCAHPGCNLPHENHIFDRVVFIQLTQNVKQADGQAVLNTAELQELLKANKVDGFTFVDTPEKFRFID
jgi:hypothetical protein